MNKQRGVTLTGLILVLVVLGMVGLLGIKLFDPYTQYFGIKKAFKALVQNPELKSGSPREVLNAYQRYAVIDNLTAIKEDQIEISKDGGRLVISATYEVKVPLFYNFSLVIDFAPSSASK